MVHIQRPEVSAGRLRMITRTSQMQQHQMQCDDRNWNKISIRSYSKYMSADQVKVKAA